MPLTLPQLSRREFLKRTVLTALGAGLVELIPAKGYAGLFGKSRDPHTFAFFSDTHIAAAPATQFLNANMADNLAACVRELCAWPAKPAAILINGDLAFSTGRAEDYATFGRLIHPLRALAPLHLSLGNHDERQHFWTAFPQDATVPRTVPQRQASVFASDRANWFLIDSLMLTNQTPGGLGAGQLDWLSRELAARPDRPALIVCHHNLDAHLNISGLVDTAALEDVFARHRQVKAFIHGHTHDWHVTTHASGVQIINLPPTGYVFQAGRPSGWVRCTLARDGAEFELRALDPHHPEQAQVKKLAWRTA
jgi:hypothetical protein